MNRPQNCYKLLSIVLIAVAAASGSACSMTLQAVSPTPNVSVSGDGKYSVDVAQVSDIQEPGRGVTINQVRQSLQNGFRNAVGSAYVDNQEGSVRLVFDAFNVSIDEGAVRILRITYRARWIAPSGELKASGTALPKNPIQTGEGHWRDALEVMFEQLVDAYDKAREKRT